LKPTLTAEENAALNEVPYGFCHCGCGERTKPSKQNVSTRGLVKGEPMRFIYGHARRRGPRDYSIEPETGCWVWERSLTTKGYGNTSKDGKTALAHRVYYEQAKGPIPEGLQIDHLCRNRACVNPDHMEAVPQQENLRRGVGTKLTAEIAAFVRSSDERPEVLGSRYGVTAGAIYAIRRGISWRDA
jgi:HNH endonuclease